MTNQELKELLELDRSTLPKDGGTEFNRLIFARSPYLLQHARNPVDWYEWGEAALAEAKARNLPLFVSIGYSTCHWCHVMAEESFEDEEVADILNNAFIPVKVDREERPDLDQFCMAACHIMNNRGGWPLNCFLRPDGSPFYALTYLPRTARNGMPGFMDLLENIARVWNQQQDAVDENANALLDALHKQSEPIFLPADPKPAELAELAVKGLRRQYDPVQHGFGNAPKFPMPPYLMFLLGRTDADQQQMAIKSLLAMRQGGIWDQLAGGIHRYSTDRNWLIPHFEKMLYDQALVAYVAIKAYSASHDQRLLEMASSLIKFVLNDLQAEQGGFYCGLDADSEGREGACYVWNKGQIEQILGDDARLFCHCYGVTEQGNFEEADENVLYLADPEMAAELEDARAKLLEVRNRRQQPLRDLKILTGWNGLMIAALACGAATTGNKHWLEAAIKAEKFISKQLVTPEGRLLRSWCQTAANIPAFLEDYAFMAWGCLEIYRAGNNADYLQKAEQLCNQAIKLFRKNNGQLVFSGQDQAVLPVNLPDIYDGVTPSGSSVLAINLQQLAALTGKEQWQKQAESIMQHLLHQAARTPLNHLWLMQSASIINT